MGLNNEMQALDLIEEMHDEFLKVVVSNDASFKQAIPRNVELEIFVMLDDPHITFDTKVEIVGAAMCLFPNKEFESESAALTTVIEANEVYLESICKN